MILSEKTRDNIRKAHSVHGIEPDDYKVKYLNIFELLQYRAHLQPDDALCFSPTDFIKFS
jgi:hypothetical protein